MVGEGRVLSELGRLAEALREEPAEAIAAYLAQVRRAVERRQSAERRDAALLEALSPDELPTPARVLQLRRNADARTRLIQAFGLYTSSDLAELRQAATRNPSSVPTKWLRDGRIFAVAWGGDRRYPGFQFDPSGHPLPGLKDILASLSPLMRGWELALWFTAPNSTLDGTRPVDLLADKPDAVFEAAAHEAESAESW